MLRRHHVTMIMTRALAEVSNLKVNRLKHNDICKFPYWFCFGVFYSASFHFIVSIKLATFCLLLPFRREIIDLIVVTVSLENRINLISFYFDFILS